MNNKDNASFLGPYIPRDFQLWEKNERGLIAWGIGGFASFYVQ